MRWWYLFSILNIQTNVKLKISVHHRSAIVDRKYIKIFFPYLSVQKLCSIMIENALWKIGVLELHYIARHLIWYLRYSVERQRKYTKCLKIAKRHLEFIFSDYAHHTGCSLPMQTQDSSKIAPLSSGDCHLLTILTGLWHHLTYFQIVMWTIVSENCRNS